MELTTLKKIIEAALMASGDVLSIERLQLLFDDFDKPKSPEIKEALDSLMDDFSGRGIELVEVASGYRFQVQKDVAPWVTRLWDEKPQRYSRALLETLSLIAYRQPITRGDIEDVRGVAVSSQIIRTLLDREWVRVVGHRDVPGRPAMYATTKEFLDYFSLKSLDELPSLDEIRDIDDANQNLDFINAEKNASATREYDFDNEGNVETRGEEILVETELELQEAQRLVQQVEDNVFNKPSEEELVAEREAERQAKADEERLSQEAAAERVLTDNFVQPSFAEMANKAQQRLSPADDVSVSPSVIDFADKIADHQARLASINTGGAVTSMAASTPDPSLSGPEELTLIQQQERLMQQLMQNEAQRQTQEVSSSESRESEEAFNETDDEAFLLAEAEAEKELLAQETLEKELLEKERLAEEALENELGFDDAGSSGNSATEFVSSTKKNSLFDD
ncbi:MAG: segregation and condensation protein B [Oleispira sp.]|jgi:segregation and condensation protein B